MEWISIKNTFYTLLKKIIYNQCFQSNSLQPWGVKHLFECNYWFSHCLTQGTAFVIVTLPHRSHRQGGSITFGTEYMGCSGFCTFCKSFTILRGTDPGLALARMCKFLAKEARLGLTFSGGACWFPQLGRKSSWAALRRDSKIWNVTRAQRRHRLTRSYPLLLTELENQRIPCKNCRTKVKTNSGFGLVLSLPVSHLLPQPHILLLKNGKTAGFVHDGQLTLSDSTRHARYLLPWSLPSFLPIFKVLRQNCRLLYQASPGVQGSRPSGQCQDGSR